MAIYSLSMSSVSRAAGSSSLATLSYITARRVVDERLSQSFSYGRGERVLGSGVVLPEGAPAEFENAAALFNSIEAFEKSSSAVVAKKMIIALPREWDLEQSREHLEEFLYEQIAGRGYACAYAIHEDSEGINPHAHVLIAGRQIDPETGEWAKLKSRKEYVLDEAGNRVPQIDPETGEQKLGKRNEKLWQRRNVQVNPIVQKETLQAIRKGWADTANKYLAPEEQISHLSLKAQGVDREATIHEGYAAQAIAKRGGYSSRVVVNQSIKDGNRVVHELVREGGRIEKVAKQVRRAAGTAINRAVGLIEEIQAALSARFKRGTIPPIVDFGGRESVARAEEYRLSREEEALSAQCFELGERETALRTDIERLNQRINDARVPREALLKGEKSQPQSLASQLSQLRAASKEVNKYSPHRGGGRGAR